MTTPERGLILRRLAEQLPEEWLRQWFPGEDPARLRTLLRAASAETTTTALVAPAAATIPSAAPTAPIPTRPAAATPSPSAAGTRCTLFSDGASRGNPGPAGAGYVILDEQGRELAAEGLFLGHCTNNVAEYRALLAGLAAAERLSCRRVDLRLDSELIVRQLQGRYQVKHPALKPLYQEVRDRLGRLPSWGVAHVPRAQNVRADQLANQGIDRKKGEG